jgi:hypothetical protein
MKILFPNISFEERGSEKKCRSNLSRLFHFTIKYK